MRIIFLGTPDFAVASLQALIHHGLNVVAVVTAPDRPAGRGMKLQASAVKQYALSQNLPVLQPEKLKNEAFLEELAAYKADLQIVVAFRMLPEVVWSMPPLGTINVHASLLPEYRGAAPINWAIINGETETGVTTFRLQHAIDTGNILLQSRVAITDDDNAGTLHDKLMHEGAALLIKTIQSLQNGTLIEHPQEANEHSKHAPKLFTETCQIDWSKSCNEVHNLIRGLSPYPAAFTMLNGKKCKVFVSKKCTKIHEGEPGSLYSDQKTYLRIPCGEGSIEIVELQTEGKTRMSIADYLRGNKINSLERK
jgi:methionyl-tRNA formyltransferase